MTAQKLNVLVVDDEVFVRLTAVDVIEEAGHIAIEASDADEAIALLGQHPEIDVVFSDIKMPGSMDGLGLAGLLHREWPAIKVILTSGHMSMNDLEPGAIFLAKPYRASALTERLAAMA